MKYDLRRMLKWCVPLTLAAVAMEVPFTIHGVMLLQYLEALNSGLLSADEINRRADMVDMVGGFAGIGLIVFTVAAYIANGMWIYRASWNARLLQPDDARIRPGWAIGWFFIPFALYWMPFRAMRQTWNSSENPAGDIGRGLPPFIGWWWAAWIVTNILGNMSFRMSMRADQTGDYTTATTLDLINTPFAIISALLLIKIMRAVTAMQTARARGDIAETFA